MHKITKARQGLIVATTAICVGALGTAATYASTEAKLASRFSADAEGWTVTGDPVSSIPAYLSDDGNPGGFIRATDSGTGGIMYWSAPAKFLGNQASTYGGQLGFDLRYTTDGFPFDASDVILKGGGVRLTYDMAKNPAHQWRHFKVPLTESGWFFGAQPATETQMRAALGGLGTLLIRAEYTSGTDVEDLDNVTLKSSSK